MKYKELLEQLEELTPKQLEHEILEGSVDKYYEKVEKAQSKQPDMEW